MNELELKDLFVSSLESRHIVNSMGDPVSFKTPEDEIRIKNEGYFGQFDLVLAIIHKHTKQYEGLREADLYDNILMRTGQLTEIAKSESCSIDSISFYPIELKSNCDILDARLPNQILNAILTFGRSIVVLDEKHVNRTSLKFLKILPATIIGYTGRDNYFKILSVFDRLVDTGMFNLPKTKFADILSKNGIFEGTDKIYRRLSNLERINQKIVFNQMYSSNTGFLKEEIEFLRQFSKIDGRLTYKKNIRKIVKESKNLKVTDYLCQLEQNSTAAKYTTDA
jgi:hypothetical protein